MGRYFTLFLALTVITFGISSCKKDELNFGANRTSGGYFPSNPGCVWAYNNDDDVYTVRASESDTIQDGKEYVVLVTDIPGRPSWYNFLQYDKKSEETVIYYIQMIDLDKYYISPVQYIKPKANIGDEWTVNATDLVVNPSYTEKSRVTFKVTQKNVTKNVLGAVYYDCLVMEVTTSVWNTQSDVWTTGNPVEYIYSKGVGLIYTGSGSYNYNYPAELYGFLIY